MLQDCWRELLIQQIFTGVLNKSTFPEVNNESNEVETNELITPALLIAARLLQPRVVNQQWICLISGYGHFAKILLS